MNKNGDCRQRASLSIVDHANYRSSPSTVMKKSMINPQTQSRFHFPTNNKPDDMKRSSIAREVKYRTVAASNMLNRDVIQLKQKSKSREKSRQNIVPLRLQKKHTIQSYASNRSSIHPLTSPIKYYLHKFRVSKDIQSHFQKPQQKAAKNLSLIQECKGRLATNKILEIQDIIFLIKRE